MSIQNEYLNGLMERVVRRDPAEPEFHQAVREVLTSLAPVVNARPELITPFDWIWNCSHAVGHHLCQSHHGSVVRTAVSYTHLSSARVSGVSLSSMTSTFSRSASASISRGSVSYTHLSGFSSSE